MPFISNDLAIELHHLPVKPAGVAKTADKTFSNFSGLSKVFRVVRRVSKAHTYFTESTPILHIRVLD